LVQCLRNDVALNGLENTLESLVAELVNIPLLLHGGRCLPIALCRSQFVDEIETLLLALEHNVLIRATTNDALKQEDGCLLFLLFFWS